MKNVNGMNKVANYVISAPSIKSAKWRYNTLKTIAKNFNKGDTFIHEDVSDFADFSTFGCMVKDMNVGYDLRIISVEKKRGSIIRDERGRAIGRTSCNVYRMDYDPERLARELESVRDAIMDMFK
jgi:hypothetical protein